MGRLPGLAIVEQFEEAPPSSPSFGCCYQAFFGVTGIFLIQLSSTEYLLPTVLVGVTSIFLFQIIESMEYLLSKIQDHMTVFTFTLDNQA